PADNPPGAAPAAPQADATKPGGTDSHDDEAAATVALPLIDLSVAKTVEPVDPADPALGIGDLIRYTITVDAAADCGSAPCAPATGVAVADVLPAGQAYESHSGPGSFEPVSGLWTIGDLAALGGHAELVVIVRVDAAAVAGGSIANLAQVVAADQHDVDSDPADLAPGVLIPASPEADSLKPAGVDTHDDEAATALTPPMIDLSLAKTVLSYSDAVPNPGDQVTFAVTVANAAGCGTFGPCDDATGVRVRDLLPTGLTFVSASVPPGTGFDPGTGVWTVGTVAAGTNLVAEITATIDGFAPVANVGEVAGADQTDVDSQPADLPPGATAPGTPEADPAVPSGTDTHDDEAAATAAVPTVDLSVTKTLDPPADGHWNLGDVATFRVTVTNATDCGVAGPCSTASALTLTDAVPAGLAVVAERGPGTFDAGTGTWTPGPLAPGSSATLELDVRVDAAGTLLNLAQVSSAAESDVDSDPADLAPGATGPGAPEADPAKPAGTDTHDDEAAAALVVPLVDLSLAKSVAPVAPATGAPYRPGERVTFTLTATNGTDCGPAGPCATATGVTVGDTLPAGFALVAADPAAQFDTATGTWTVPDLAPGASTQLTLTATIAPTGPWTNVAEVRASALSDLDSDPADLAPGATAPGAPEADPAKPAGTDTHDDEAAASVVVPFVDLALTKTAAPLDPADPALNLGEAVRFTLIVANAADCTTGTGPATPCATATGVVVTDALPAGLTHVSHSGPGTYDPATGVWAVGSLAPDTSATLELVVTVDAFGALVNYAQVGAADQADVDSDPADNAGPTPGSPAADATKASGTDTHDDEAAATVALDVVDLSLTKTATLPVGSPLSPGDEVTFTVTVQAAALCVGGACSTATGVSVTDVLPAGLTLVSHATATGTFAAGVWDVGSLAPGASASLDLVARVDDLAATNFAQVATVDQTDVDSDPADRPATGPAGDPTEADATKPGGLDSHDDEDTASVAVELVDLSLTKAVDTSAAGPVVNVGDLVTFTLTVAN
ncbi:MAG: DUF11 domain-containing protein, partial [Acidimicrobiia bacterium]|nr:DUF11 domain-containing protein [Acidimicrobiia bacterium]